MIGKFITILLVVCASVSLISAAEGEKKAKAKAVNGVITAIDEGSITIELKARKPKGDEEAPAAESRTFSIDAGTTITVNGEAATAADLAVDQKAKVKAAGETAIEITVGKVKKEKKEKKEKKKKKKQDQDAEEDMDDHGAEDPDHGMDEDL